MASISIKQKTIKRVIALSVMIALALSLSPGAGPALAQGEPEITKTTIEAEFPAYINFMVEASASAEITDISLHYRVIHDSYARVVSEGKPIFISAAAVSATWIWDMRRSGGLPPGTAVEYWWTVTDAAGKSATSVPETYIFEDTRFQWRQVAQGNLILNWYSGSEGSARGLLTASLEGLEGLEAKTGARLTAPVRVYVYADTEDMLEAMIFPQDWTGAATYTDYATIIIGLSSDGEWNTDTMVHELAHVVSYQMTRGPYSSLPVWLSEGFSMYAEGEMDLYFTSTLVSALNDDATITVRSLSCPFSADPALSYLAYAQSYSLVDYLVATYGQTGILELLDVFKRGADYDEALREVYGFDMDGLYGRWLEYALREYVGIGAV
jgi:hypothetical protein